MEPWHSTRKISPLFLGSRVATELFSEAAALLLQELAEVVGHWNFAAHLALFVAHPAEPEVNATLLVLTTRSAGTGLVATHFYSARLCHKPGFAAQALFLGRVTGGADESWPSFGHGLATDGRFGGDFVVQTGLGWQHQGKEVG